MVRIAAAAIMMAASTKALTRGAFNRLTPTALLGSLLGANGDKYAGAVMGTEDIMKPKAHGACPARIFTTFASTARRTPSPRRRRHITRVSRRHVRDARPEGFEVELRRPDGGPHLQL